jgi:hypothetical protein
MAAGIADPNPYDGRDYDTIDLWSYDHYHASAEGSYLEALTVFAQVTGYDVRQFGGKSAPPTNSESKTGWPKPCSASPQPNWAWPSDADFGRWRGRPGKG